MEIKAVINYSNGIQTTVSGDDAIAAIKAIVGESDADPDTSSDDIKSATIQIANNI